MPDPRITDEGHLRDGYRWCPNCGGHGTTTRDVMYGPDHDTIEENCTHPGCAEGRGILPIEGSDD